MSALDKESFEDDRLYNRLVEPITRDGLSPSCRFKVLREIIKWIADDAGEWIEDIDTPLGTLFYIEESWSYTSVHLNLVISKRMQENINTDLLSVCTHASATYYMRVYDAQIRVSFASPFSFAREAIMESPNPQWYLVDYQSRKRLHRLETEQEKFPPVHGDLGEPKESVVSAAFNTRRKWEERVKKKNGIRITIKPN